MAHPPRSKLTFHKVNVALLTFVLFTTQNRQLETQVKQQDALGLLTAYSFITGQANDRIVSLHRLVHLATRNWLRNRGVLEQWVVNTGRQLRDVFPSDAHENRILWPLCSSCKVMSSKAIHRTENIWFRRLHDAFTVTEDILKRKHYLKRCLRGRKKS